MFLIICLNIEEHFIYISIASKDDFSLCVLLNGTFILKLFDFMLVFDLVGRWSSTLIIRDLSLIDPNINLDIFLFLDYFI